MPVTALTPQQLDALDIRPAGMTYERALQIAVDIPDEAESRERKIDIQIRRLNLIGRNDLQIAKHLGMNHAYISRRRRVDLALPRRANPGHPPAAEQPPTHTQGESKYE